MSELQNELRRKGRIEIGDRLMLYGGEWRLLKVGDTYIGHTEGEDPEILTVRRIEVQKRRTNQVMGKVYPKERKKKLYDLDEVVKVTFIDNPNLDKEKKLNEHRTVTTNRADVRSEVPAPGGPKPTPTPKLNRPVPAPPRRGGPTDYSRVSVQGSQGRGVNDGDASGS